MFPLLRVGSAHSFRPFLKFDDRGPCPVVALEPGPVFRFSNERAELAEQLLPRHGVATERLDALDPAENTTRFVHVDNASPQSVTCL
jgi:hypothetical protein